MQVRRSASFSTDLRYRYRLGRTWDIRLPTICGIGNNPSVAGKDTDDLTVTKFMGFASRWGFGSFVLLNLKAFVATKPKDLLTADDPIGPLNWGTLCETIQRRYPTLCFWGDLAEKDGQAREVERMLRHWQVKLYCLGLTKKGNPKHLSRLGYDTPMQLWLPTSEGVDAMRHKEE